MSYKIGLLSDPHATLAPLQQALEIFAQQQVDMSICAGDIAGYGDDQIAETLDLLKQKNVHMVAGNHDSISEITSKSQIILDNQTKLTLNELPDFLTFNIDDISLYVVHAEPPDKKHGGIKLLDPDGEIITKRINYWETQLQSFNYDILIIGHTHQIFSQTIANTLVINPGSSKYNHSCMILELPSLTTQIYSLSGKKPIYTWNWGHFYQEQQHHS